MSHLQDWTEENKQLPTLVQFPEQSTFRGKLQPEEQFFFEEWIQPNDVVHLHGPWERSHHDLAKVCRQKKVPYCISTHGMLDGWSMSQKWLKKRAFWYWFGRSYFKNAFTVHTTAIEEKKQVEPWVQGTSIEVIPLIMELEPFENLPGPGLAANAFGISADEKVVLFLSRVHLKKGVEVFLEAVEIARRGQPAMRAIVAGPGEAGYVKKIENDIKVRGLEDHVTLVGPTHGEEKLSLYQRADVFALPTHQENFGLVFPEAMACRTPVITTRGVDIWRELQQAGARIVDRTAEAFAAEISSLLEDEQTRTRVGEQGREWVFGALNSTDVVNRFLEMYEVGHHSALGGNLLQAVSSEGQG